MMQQQMQQQNEWINILLQAQTNQHNTANQTQNPARVTATQTDRNHPKTAETLEAAASSPAECFNINPNNRIKYLHKYKYKYRYKPIQHGRRRQYSSPPQCSPLSQ